MLRLLLNWVSVLLLCSVTASAFTCGTGFAEPDSNPFRCACGGNYIWRLNCNGLDGGCETGARKYCIVGEPCNYITAQDCQQAKSLLKPKAPDLWETSTQSLASAANSKCGKGQEAFEKWLVANSRKRSINKIADHRTSSANEVII
jgi:hypothetical protein